MYTDLGSAANLTVKFQMNPVSKYTVSWFMGDSVLKYTNVRNPGGSVHVQIAYFVSYVTKKRLGNYTVEVINLAISEHNKVTFHMMLKLRGKKGYAFIHLIFCVQMLHVCFVQMYVQKL